VKLHDIKVFKVVKEFSYDGINRLYKNTILVEPSPNIIKFGKIRIGDTQELIEEGYITELIIPKSYF